MSTVTKHQGLSPANVQGLPLLAPSGKRKTHADWLEPKPGKKRIDGVPIFAVGTHKGIVYTRADLAEMVRAYEPTLHQIQPVIKLGHDDAQGFAQLTARGTKPTETSLGLPNLGFPDNLRTNPKRVVHPVTGQVWEPGELLIADYTDLDDQTFDDIESNRYPKRSAEIVRNYRDTQHQDVTWPRVVQAVSLLGDELPAVRGMPSRVELNAEAVDALDIVTFSQGDLPMGMGIPNGGGGAVTLETIAEGNQKLLAAVTQVIELLKKDVAQEPAAAAEAGMAAAKKPDEMAAAVVPPVAAPAAVAPTAMPAVPAAPDKPAATVQIHSDPTYMAKMAEVDSKLSELATATRRTLEREARTLQAEAQAEAVRFAESLCRPENYRIPAERKAQVAAVYAAQPDVQKFSDHAGAQKTGKQQFMDLMNSLPLLAPVDAFEDRAKDLQPAGASKVASEVQKMAEKDSVDQKIPYHAALLNRVQNMSDDEYRAFHEEGFAQTAGRNGAGKG